MILLTIIFRECLPDVVETSTTTPWGTFMYAKMPFGLMNARDTF
jgi:hypothetical protein